MKSNLISPLTCTLVAASSLLVLATPRTDGADGQSRSATASTSIDKAADIEKDVAVKVVDDDDEDTKPAKVRAWLGVSVEEASEALTEQLGLEPGVGLVVMHVSKDSPAAKADLKRNDVLVELAGHALAHQAQLRRLVQARKVGDELKLAYYRSGKKQTASATLEKAPARFGLLDEDFDGKLGELHRKMLELPRHETLQAGAKALHDSLRHI